MPVPFDRQVRHAPPHPAAAERAVVEAEGNVSRIRQMLAFGRNDVSPADLEDAERTLELARASMAAQSGAATPIPTSGMTALGSVLPVTAQTAASGDDSIFNPKIWDADLECWRGRKFSIRRWLGTCRAVTKKARKKGHVHAGTIMEVCNALERATRETDDGKAVITFEAIAEFAARCKETARKVIRWLESMGLVDTFNVLTRGRSGKQVRAANMYLLTIPDDAPVPAPEAADEIGASPAAEDASAAGMDRFRPALRKLSTWIPSFPGLVIQSWGFNRASRKIPRDGLPAPG